METPTSKKVAVDNSELGPDIIYDEGYRTLREDVLTISRALGEAVIGACVDVTKNSYAKVKTQAVERISSIFPERTIRHSQYLRNKKRFVAKLDKVGLKELDDSNNPDNEVIFEVKPQEEIIN